MQLDDQIEINKEWDRQTDVAHDCIKDVIKLAQDHAYNLGLKRAQADALSLEKQYSERLGRLAQLCDTVIPWVMGPVTDGVTIPNKVRSAIGEIMDYVDAVRP